MQAKRKLAWAGTLPILVFATGCPPRGQPPIDAGDALDRVNSNLSRINQPLVYRSADVSFHFNDERGKRHRFYNHPAYIVFKPARCLYFSVKGTTGQEVARLGSNDARYWLWIEPELSKMWWGEWSDLDQAGRRGDLPIPPDQVLTALALRPLETQGPDGSPPVLRRVDGRYVLVYHAGGRGGRYVQREVHLDRSAPYQPRRIIHRRSDGRVIMDASLSSYSRVGRDGPYTPRRYVIRWPIDDAYMTLDLRSAALNPDQAPFCEFPTDPPVSDVERIGERPSGMSQAAP